MSYGNLDDIEMINVNDNYKVLNKGVMQHLI